MTMVNFRMPAEQYATAQHWAERRKMSFSDFMRLCVASACRHAEEEEARQSAWKDALPRSVRDLIGIAGAPSSDGDEREEHLLHLEKKYA